MVERIDDYGYLVRDVYEIDDHDGSVAVETYILRYATGWDRLRHGTFDGWTLLSCLVLAAVVGLLAFVLLA